MQSFSVALYGNIRVVRIGCGGLAAPITIAAWARSRAAIRASGVLATRSALACGTYQVTSSIDSLGDGAIAEDEDEA